MQIPSGVDERKYRLSKDYRMYIEQDRRARSEEDALSRDVSKAGGDDFDECISGVKPCDEAVSFEESKLAIVEDVNNY